MYQQYSLYINMYQQYSLCISNTVRQLFLAVHTATLKWVTQTFGQQATQLTRHFHQTVAQLTLWTIRSYQILRPSFKFTSLLKLSVPKSKAWLAPNYYPNVMNIWLPSGRSTCFWDAGCYGNVEANSGISSYSTFRVIHTNCSQSIYSFHLLSAVLNKDLSENTEYGSLGCVRWRENQWRGVPRFFFSLSKTGYVRVASRG